MTIQKKIWETPSLKDLNVTETESATYPGPVENTSYSPSAISPTPAP